MTTTLVRELDAMQVRLEALTRQHRVPGASLAVLLDGSTLEFATGVTNVHTGVEATPDALFQIGSITKVYTTVLVMQLVDQGRIELDAPVRTYVPEFTLADDGAADAITVRHLLTHTSGIPGDHFPAIGYGDDNVARYVDSLRTLPLEVPTGSIMSYSNAGFVLAGRLVEKVTDMPYAAALNRRLLRPLGADRTTVLPEEMLRHRYAVGNLPTPGTRALAPAPRMFMEPSLSPAGALTSATARDVLAMARMHLDGGRGPDGARVLSAGSVNAMQHPEVPVPEAVMAQVAGPPVTGAHVGLGWFLGWCDGTRVIAHNGGTLGQSAWLFAAPDDGFAVVLLTNASNEVATGLWHDFGGWLLSDVAGIHGHRTPPVGDPRVPLDLSRYEGRYESLGFAYDVEAADGELLVVPGGLAVEMLAVRPRATRWHPVDEHNFAGPLGMLISFVEFDEDDRPRYLHNGRACRRVE